MKIPRHNDKRTKYEGDMYSKHKMYEFFFIYIVLSGPSMCMFRNGRHIVTAAL